MDNTENTMVETKPVAQRRLTKRERLTKRAIRNTIIIVALWAAITIFVNIWGRISYINKIEIQKLQAEITQAEIGNFN